MNAQLNKLYRQLTADKRKLTLMLVLVLVALGLWGRLLLQPGPEQAQAQDAASNKSSMPEVTDVTLRNKPAAPDLPVVEVSLPDELPRDLFKQPRVKKEKKNRQKQAKSAESSADTGYTTPDVSGLTLQSVMQGPRSRAMINGRMIAKGETIQGFTLIAIKGRYVILEKHGHQVRLAL
jgi:hypothetical protein